MDEEEQHSPESNGAGFFRDSMTKNQVQEEPGSEMEQQIQQMVAGRIVSINRPVKQESGIQYRPHHMVEVADKDFRAVKVWIKENRKAVVVLKGTKKSSGIAAGANRHEQQEDEQRTLSEPFHGVLILHRVYWV